jgi:hypothetical protein
MRPNVPYEVMVKANQLGLRGQIVVDWIPPENTCDDPEGFLVTMPCTKQKITQE